MLNTRIELLADAECTDPPLHEAQQEINKLRREVSESETHIKNLEKQLEEAKKSRSLLIYDMNQRLKKLYAAADRHVLEKKELNKQIKELRKNKSYFKDQMAELYENVMHDNEMQ